jgi:hypothetical protein
MTSDDFPEPDDIPWAPPHIRLEYEAALGKFMLAYNQLDHLLSEVLTMALEELGRHDLVVAKGGIEKTDFWFRLFVLDLLRSTSVSQAFEKVDIKGMRDISAERAVVAHGHMDQNPYDGSFTLIKSGVDKGDGYTSERLANLAEKADQLWYLLRYADAYFTFKDESGDEAMPLPGPQSGQ